MFIAKAQENNVRYEPDTIKTYDIGQNIDEIVPSMLQIRQYNEHGLMTVQETKYWADNEDEYKNSERLTFTYYDNMLRESEVTHFWSNEADAWETKFKIEYFYDGANTVSTINYEWNEDSEIFVYNYKGEFEYDEQNNMTAYASYHWINEDWVLFAEYKNIFTYDDNLNLTSIKEIVVNLANPDDTSKYTYYTFSYDDVGTLVADTSSMFNNDVETKYSYNTYSYDNQKNLIQRVTMEWDNTENDYVYASWDGRITYEYDSNNNRLSHLRETYDNSLGGWKVDGWNPRTKWEYENNNAVVIESFYFNEYEGEWEISTSGHVDIYYNNMETQFETMLGGCRFEISYLAFEVTAVKKEEMANIIIFPNPAKDKLYISGIQEPSLVTIYDLSGKKIDEKIINSSSQSFSINEYNDGVYIIHIQNSTQRLVKKIIKR